MTIKQLKFLAKNLAGFLTTDLIQIVNMGVLTIKPKDPSKFDDASFWHEILFSIKFIIPCDDGSDFKNGFSGIEGINIDRLEDIHNDICKLLSRKMKIHNHYICSYKNQLCCGYVVD